jgi:tyrosine decarboxylase
MLSSGLGIVGFSWAASPACTELETIVLDWLGKLMGLPKDLLPFEDQFDENMNSPMIKNQSYFDGYENEETNEIENDSSIENSYFGGGENMQNGFKPHCSGGVLLGTASECVLISMLSARRLAIQRFKKSNGPEEDGTILNKLVAYSSKLSHSCVEKAAMISLVKIKLLEVDENYSLRGDTLAKAINDDLSQGLIPFYVCGTLGTTSCCSYDNINELGLICQKYDLYLHIDAAYAGNALICDEFRQYMTGLQVNSH